VVQIHLPQDANLLEQGHVVEVALELDRQDAGIGVPPVVRVDPKVVAGVDPVVVRREAALGLAEKAAAVLGED
jgi:hypothetical protein